MRGLLVGAVDMHVHCAPDVVPRKLGALELAERAKAAGMRAVVIKSHAFCTAPLAKLVAEATGFEVFGGLALNDPVGGINPEAVRAAIALGAKVIWMPTLSARNHIERLKGAPAYLRSLGGGRKGIYVIDASGRLRPEVIEVMELVGEAGAVLATGHLSFSEVLALAEEAQRRGLRKLVVTHPEFHIISMTKEQQRQLLPFGVYFERCYFAVTQLGQGLDPSVIAEDILETAPQRTILASDLGQVENPDPLEGLERLLKAMLRHGLSEEDLRLMVVDNPHRLLDLR